MTSLGAMTLGPKTVVPKGAKLTTVNARGNSEKIQPSTKPSLLGNGNGTKETKKINVEKSLREEKDMTQNLEPLRQEETTPETQRSIIPLLENESNESTRSMVLSTTDENSKQAVLQVINSTNTLEKRLMDVIESQIPHSEYRKLEHHQSQMIVEASKGILVAMKLKLDAARVLREMKEE
jgi:hypothetical protein